MDKCDVLGNSKQVFKNRITVCPVCGKSFLVSSRTDYSYKAVNKSGKIRYLCSWSCFNNAATDIANSKGCKNG